MLDWPSRRSGRTVLPLAAALSLPLCTGCGPVSYMPKPSPRIQVSSEGSSLVFVRDGRKFKMGPLGGGLDDLVRGNPRAEEEAKSFETKTTTGFIFSILGAASAGAGSGLFVANELSRSPTGTMRGVSVALLASGVVFGLVGSLVMQSATPHVWNAVNIYNDSLPPPYGPPQYPANYSMPRGYGAPPSYAPPQQPPTYAPPQQPPSYAPPPPPQ